MRLHPFAVIAACVHPHAGAFRTIALPEGFRPVAIVAGDFTGDGLTDVALCGESEQLVVLVGDGRGGLRAASDAGRCGAHPTNAIAADVDGDGRLDIVVANHDTDHLTLLRNTGGGRFAASAIAIHSHPHPHTVAAADVDGDGHVDLVTDSWGEDRLTLVLADGRGGWRSPGTPIEVGRKPYINVVAADLDGDGHVDLVMPNFGFETISILFGDGSGGFAPATRVAAGPTPFFIAVEDVDRDGRPDIVVANYSGHMADTSRDGITWIQNAGERRFVAHTDRVAVGRGCWRLAAGDLDRDGFADAAFINAADDTIGTVFGSRAGLRAGSTVTVMPHPHAVAIATLRTGAAPEILAITEERAELAIAALP